ncbi:hypothetical protein AN286_10075 [Aliarcobacter cryaerophilus ATCC 43158]|nr:hypothetical protein CJ667_10305 [Aliarcobacter cryaerophilus]QCZ24727.1 hypothetical protein AN286_10075 [Aliarcobacter cryaerophilus ATCC 43158]
MKLKILILNYKIHLNIFMINCLNYKKMVGVLSKQLKLILATYSKLLKNVYFYVINIIKYVL